MLMEEKNRGLGQAVPAQTAGLNERLSQLPAARDAGGITVPSRQTNEDIDESAFGFEEEIAARTNPATQHHVQAATAPRPAPLPVRPVPQPNQTMQPIRQDVTPPPAPSFTPPTNTTPTVAATSQPALPSPPATSQQTTDQPVSMSIGQVRAGDVGTYGPATSHIPEEYAARISEKPQKNSSDIAAEVAREKRIHRLKSFVSFLCFIGGIFVAAFLINQFIFQSYYVDGTSMTPTLADQDRLIIDKVERTIAHAQGQPYIPKRGQIVVLDSSIVGLNGQREQLIKRVIGLPGDTIIIKDGSVTIKNVANPDGFNPEKQLGLSLKPTYVDAPLELTVPAGQVFVMGDNRGQNGSHDSRAFGPVESAKIEGRLWARILPLEQAKLFD